MNVLRWLGVGVFALGVALLALAFARGDAALYLVLIFPVIEARGLLAFGAIAAMFSGIVLFFVGFARTRTATLEPSADTPVAPEAPAKETGAPRRTRAGGVVFLGPIPIIFGSDTQVAKWMIVVAAVLFVLLVAFWIAIALL